jgi:hypothetical protein
MQKSKMRFISRQPKIKNIFFLCVPFKTQQVYNTIMGKSKAQSKRGGSKKGSKKGGSRKGLNKWQKFMKAHSKAHPGKSVKSMARAYKAQQKK